MLLALLLAAAMPPGQANELRALSAIDARVAAVGDRLARGGLCRQVLSSPGWVLQDAAQYSPGLREAARTILGLGEWPSIVALVPGSAATRSGLQPGDEIVAVNGTPVPAKARGYARVEQVEQLVEDALSKGIAQLQVRRAGKQIDVGVAPEPGCRSRFQLLTGRGLNAKADGRYVQVTGELVAFVKSDDELALVIAHELAHNILGHRERLDAAGVSRGLFVGLGKNRMRIRETELEADRLALYLMARAGYDIAVAPAFWERFGHSSVPGFLSDGTHPGARERARRAEAEIARIRAQQAGGQAPTP
ncbi:M48 family metalloprotease [Sphingomonas sp. ID1715]|uniref:M48 family metallopeptidase n=1 Tax=Sphingomonas sp. ID1715 TaxID=1656898 RepID=UPI0014897A73|nr:M48 family metallopeptidase [Sphingomonas sp. ID1715]NNM75616.1 M48 family metalloprotease [Sphingomonas sp. ID1715]